MITIQNVSKSLAIAPVTRTSLCSNDRGFDRTSQIGTLSTSSFSCAEVAERVEKALRSSTFNNQCVGKTMELVFSFELGNDMPVGGSKQTISFSYPNRFTITSTAVLVNP